MPKEKSSNRFYIDGVTMEQSLSSSFDPYSGIDVPTNFKQTKLDISQNQDGRVALGLLCFDEDNINSHNFPDILGEEFKPIEKPNLVRNGNCQYIDSFYEGTDNKIFIPQGGWEYLGMNGLININYEQEFSSSLINYPPKDNFQQENATLDSKTPFIGYGGYYPYLTPSGVGGGAVDQNLVQVGSNNTDVRIELHDSPMNPSPYVDGWVYNASCNLIKATTDDPSRASIDDEGYHEHLSLYAFQGSNFSTVPANANEIGQAEWEPGYPQTHPDTFISIEHLRRPMGTFTYSDVVLESSPIVNMQIGEVQTASDSPMFKYIGVPEFDSNNERTGNYILFWDIDANPTYNGLTVGQIWPFYTDIASQTVVANQKIVDYLEEKHAEGLITDEELEFYEQQRTIYCRASGPAELTPLHEEEDRLPYTNADGDIGGIVAGSPNVGALKIEFKHKGQRIFNGQSANAFENSTSRPTFDLEFKVFTSEDVAINYGITYSAINEGADEVEGLDLIKDSMAANKDYIIGDNDQSTNSGYPVFGAWAKHDNAFSYGKCLVFNTNYSWNSNSYTSWTNNLSFIQRYLLVDGNNTFIDDNQYRSLNQSQLIYDEDDDFLNRYSSLKIKFKMRTDLIYNNTYPNIEIGIIEHPSSKLDITTAIHSPGGFNSSQYLNTRDFQTQRYSALQGMSRFVNTQLGVWEEFSFDYNLYKSVDAETTYIDDEETIAYTFNAAEQFVAENSYELGGGGVGYSLENIFIPLKHPPQYISKIEIYSISAKFFYPETYDHEHGDDGEHGHNNSLTSGGIRNVSIGAQNVTSNNNAEGYNDFGGYTWPDGLDPIEYTSDGDDFNNRQFLRELSPTPLVIDGVNLENFLSNFSDVAGLPISMYARKALPIQNFIFEAGIKVYYKDAVIPTPYTIQDTNLHFFVQSGNYFKGRVLIDDIEVFESYDFQPDVDVRKKIAVGNYGKADLTKYYDPIIHGPNGTDEYKDTVAPLEAQFYFYPTYPSDKILDNKAWNNKFAYRLPMFQDFRLGCFYVKDVDWGDGSPLEFTEAEQIKENKALYHTYETLGVYEITGKMFRVKLDNDGEIEGTAVVKRFTLTININEGNDEEFLFFGSDGHSFIPFRKEFPVIGGISKHSIYYKTIKRQLGFIGGDTRTYVEFEKVSDKLKTELALLKMDDDDKDSLDVLTEYQKERFLSKTQETSDTKIYNGLTAIEESMGKGIGDCDITTIKYYNEPKSIHELFGFDEYDEDIIGKPDESRYWKKIIPQDYSIFNREGLDGNPFTLVDTYSEQDWLNVDYYYPVLPKLGQDGKFINVMDGEGNYIPNTYPNNKIPFPLEGEITDENESNEKLLFNIVSEQIEGNVLADNSDNENLGMVFSDYKPKFQSNLSTSKIKVMDRIKTSTNNGAF